MSTMLDQLKEGSKKHTAELQKEKDEVTRLKTEIEKLKKEHSDEIAEITTSCSTEIEDAKKAFDDIRIEGIAEVTQCPNAEFAKEKKAFAVIEPLGKLLKEQNDLLNDKLSAWKDMAERLNHDMEGKPRLFLPSFLSVF